MHKHKPTRPSAIWLLPCVLVLSACNHGGVRIAPEPPKVTLPPLPADKMATPTFGQQVRAELLASPTTPIDGSAGSKPN